MNQFRIQRIELAGLSGPATPASPPQIASAGQPPASSAGPAGTPAAGRGTFPAVTSLAKPAGGAPPAVMQCVALVEHPLGSGSGFAIGKRLVVTNAHVVEGVFADEIKVRFGTESEKPQPATRILYIDRLRDLCVFETKTDLPGLSIRGDYACTAGDRVTLVGNPSAGGGS